jgi:hypothetical protein
VFGSDWDKVKAATMEALREPRVGDRFHEMYSFWMFVVELTPTHVVTMVGIPPVTFPDEATVEIRTREDFVDHYTYNNTHLGSWVTLAGRDADVGGWYADEGGGCDGVLF